MQRQIRINDSLEKFIMIVHMSEMKISETQGLIIHYQLVYALITICTAIS